ncbi:hypothetical protein AYI68_g6126 [Smittium mucronatum]|uniref:Uncharacterized protein n=1 Tax=Smittium mucronatum TaxID=133383 RepID=A0A1R0GSC0_9FUNG|nr:hypothetical protein AYI68_g6126 [Smittium mucronatum]
MIKEDENHISQCKIAYKKDDERDSCMENSPHREIFRELNYDLNAPYAPDAAKKHDQTSSNIFVESSFTKEPLVNENSHKTIRQTSLFKNDNYNE